MTNDLFYLPDIFGTIFYVKIVHLPSLNYIK